MYVYMHVYRVTFNTSERPPPGTSGLVNQLQYLKHTPLPQRQVYRVTFKHSERPPPETSGLVCQLQHLKKTPSRNVRSTALVSTPLRDPLPKRQV